MIHDPLVDDLAARSPALLEAALALGMPPACDAPSMDDDSRALLLLRTGRMAACLTQRLSSSHVRIGSAVAGIQFKGPHGTLEALRRTDASKANGEPHARLSLAHHRPGDAGMVSLRCPFPGPMDSVVATDGSTALAAILAARRAALSTDPTPTEGARRVGEALAVVAGGLLRPELRPGFAGGPPTAPRTVVVVATDGARPPIFRPAWASSSGGIALDDDTVLRLAPLVAPALTLWDEGCPRGDERDVQTRPGPPRTGYALSRTVVRCAVPVGPPDPMALLRALAELGLDSMPLLVRRDDR